MLKGKVRVRELLDGVLVTGAGESAETVGSKRTVQLIGSTSAGAGAASVTVQTSNDNTNWTTVDTLTLTLGTVVTSDVYTSDLPWKYIRGNVGSISGTGASVTLYLGEEVQS